MCLIKLLLFLCSSIKTIMFSTNIVDLNLTKFEQGRKHASKNTYKFGPTPIYHHDHYYYCYFANTIVIKRETYFSSLGMENSILNFFSKSHCYLKRNVFSRALKYLRNYFFLSFFFSSVQGVPY